MDFIFNEAEVAEDDFKLRFSDDSDEESASPPSEDNDFITDEEIEAENEPSFYRSVDNREEFYQFKNQFKNPVEVPKRSEDEFYGEDDLPEMYVPEKREHVTFHLFQNEKERAFNFKKSQRCFSDEIQNHFFCSVIYGIMHQKTEGKNLELKFAEEILGREFFLKLKEIEPDIMLDHTIFGFFNRCTLINELIAQFGYFLRFYERRNKFRYQLRQKVKSKNEMRSELSACVIQKFNGYDLLRNKLQRFEKKDLFPIDIVYRKANFMLFCT